MECSLIHIVAAKNGEWTYLSKTYCGYKVDQIKTFVLYKNNRNATCPECLKKLELIKQLRGEK